MDKTNCHPVMDTVSIRVPIRWIIEFCASCVSSAVRQYLQPVLRVPSGGYEVGSEGVEWGILKMWLLCIFYHILNWSLCLKYSSFSVHNKLCMPHCNNWISILSIITLWAHYYIEKCILLYSRKFVLAKKYLKKKVGNHCCKTLAMCAIDANDKFRFLNTFSKNIVSFAYLF
jgi:hypothetical protein